MSSVSFQRAPDPGRGPGPSTPAYIFQFHLAVLTYLATFEGGLLLANPPRTLDKRQPLTGTRVKRSSTFVVLGSFVIAV